ncbi:MAG: glycerol-3-phosphate 1-O-acyltransferase PlsY [Pseudomonadota bacterium]
MTDLKWTVAAAFCDPPAILALEAGLPYYLLAFGLAFLIGAIPFGLLVARGFGLGDIRKIGSGNIGATNVLRTGNKTAAALTLALDAAKGAIPALLGFYLAGPIAAACAGLGGFLGHCYSPFLGFKGGKGVATGFGVLLAWRWELGLICALVWVATALLVRISSVASLATAVAAVIAANALAECDALPFAIVMAAVLIWRHRANIARLIRGEEPRIGGARPASGPPAP